MIDSSIEYKSIIMRCDRIDRSALHWLAVDDTYAGKGYAEIYDI